MLDRPRDSLRRIPRPLALLLVLGSLHLLAWAIIVPPFQGPDEDAHFAYLQQLAETGHLPSPTTGASSNSTEAQVTLDALNLFALRGVPSARPAWSSADLANWRALERALPPGAQDDGVGANPQAKNPPLYYALMAVPYQALRPLSLLKRLFVLRLLNLPFYLATIAFTWLLAGEVFARSRWKQTLAAGVVALQPQLAFMAAIVNSDVLLTAATSGLIYTAVRMVRRGPALGTVVAASALTGAAMLTHGRGLITLPILLVALLVVWLRYAPSPRDALVRGAVALGTVGGAALLYLAFGRSGGGLYGGQVSALNSVGSFSFKQFLSSIYQFYFSQPHSSQPRLGPAFGYRQVFIDSFYGSFGWLEVRYAPRLYDILQIGSALGLVGLYTACVARWRRFVRDWPTVMVLLSALVTAVVFLHYVSYRALLTNGGTDPLIVGRYLLPIISLFGVAIAFTVGALPARAARFAGAAILVLGVLLSLGALEITLERFA